MIHTPTQLDFINTYMTFESKDPSTNKKQERSMEKTNESTKQLIVVILQALLNETILPFVVAMILYNGGHNNAR